MTKQLIDWTQIAWTCSKRRKIQHNPHHFCQVPWFPYAAYSGRLRALVVGNERATPISTEIDVIGIIGHDANREMKT